MRLPTRRYSAALMVATVLAAALSAVAASEPPPAVADTQSSNTQECDSPGWTPGIGTHNCHNLGPLHYTITSFYRRDVSSQGPGTACNQQGEDCYQTATAKCEHRTSPSGTCSLPSGSGSGWYLTSSQSSGSHAHAIASTVTFGCRSGSHRHGSGCHRHLAPGANLCGVVPAHTNTRSTSPVRGGSTSYGGGDHSNVDTGRTCRPVNRQTATTTTTTVPDGSVLAVAGETVGEGDGAADFTITLSAAAAADVTFDVATSDGTATAGDDYTSVTREVTITAGRTSAVVSVTVTDDTDDEPDETFTLTLSNPSSNASLDASSSAAEATITDDDVSTGPTNVSFRCTGKSPRYRLLGSWSAPAGGGVDSFRWQLSKRGHPFAHGGLHHFAKRLLSGSINEYRGRDSGTYWMHFRANLTGGGTGDTFSYRTVCTNLPKVSVSDAADAREGLPLVFTVSLTEASSSNVTVNVAASGGTATSGRDYLSPASTVTITAGETSAEVSVPTVSDTDDELDETVGLTVSSPRRAVLDYMSATAVGRILDDDEPTVSVTGTAVDEDAGSATFTVTLSQPPIGAVQVDVATSDGTATAGDDYTTVSRRVSVPAGQRSISVSVPVVDDTDDEPDETFSLTLSNPSGATLSTSTQATATIRDNDTPPPPPAPKFAS